MKNNKNQGVVPYPIKKNTKYYLMVNLYFEHDSVEYIE